MFEHQEQTRKRLTHFSALFYYAHAEVLLFLTLLHIKSEDSEMIG